MAMPVALSEEQREKQRERSRRHYWKHRETIIKKTCGYHAARRQKLRQEVLALLGNQCAQCTWTDERALHIDHVHSGGTQEREKFNHENYYQHVKQSILAGECRYQLLCANHNAIKARTNPAERGGRRKKEN